MRRVIAIGFKDLRLLKRDKMGMVWVIVFPLVVAVFFGSILGGAGKGGHSTMSIAVMDRDDSPGSRAFVQRLEESDALSIKEEMTPDQARDAVRRGKLVAFVIVEKGYGDSWEIFHGGKPPVTWEVDRARQVEKGLLGSLIMEASFQVLRERFSDPASMREQISKAVKSIDEQEDLTPGKRAMLKTFFHALDAFIGAGGAAAFAQDGTSTPDEAEAITPVPGKTGPKSAFAVTFPQAILWGMLGCAAGFAVSMVKERTEGTLLRLRIAPLSQGQILAGKGLACFLACVGVTVFILLVGRLKFSVRIENPTGLVLATVSTAACFVGMTMLLGMTGKTPPAVEGAVWGIGLLMAMLGGGMLPLIAMPSWLRTVSVISPIRWGILAFEGAIWRHFSLSEMALPCAILVTIGVACFTAGVAVLRRTQT